MLEELREDFDDLMERANEAAVTLDAKTLDLVTESIDSWSTKLREIEPNEEFLTHVRAGLVQFRELCRFVGETLHDAMASADGSPEPTKSPYSKQGKVGMRRAGPVLLKQYG